MERCRRSPDAERALEASEEAFAAMDVDAVVAHLCAAIQGFTAGGQPCRAAMACVAVLTRAQAEFAAAMHGLRSSCR